VVHEENNDDDGRLRAFGWALVDVPGDGNCGPYVLILGLENYNRTLYNPFYVDESGQEVGGRRDIDEGDLKLEWQKQTIRIREDLRRHSIRLLKTKYKLGQEPPWWWMCGPMEKNDRAKSHDNIYMRGYKVQHYFPKCDEELMMDGMWWSFVFASLF